MIQSVASACILVVLLLGAPPNTRAWDYEGHRLINQLALESLPTNFPAFVTTAAARERIQFLAGEPDRWRNSSEPSLKHANGPDHYFDLDLLPACGLEISRLSPFRSEFTAQLAAARTAHAKDLPAIDPAKDLDRTRELIGYLPWTIVEYQGRLKSAFSYLKEYEAAGTPEEIANAQANVIYVMGVMGHFVGDGSQPLHTTRHHHGWVGENPQHYSTNSSIHGWIDGGYLAQFGFDEPALRRQLRPARPLARATQSRAQAQPQSQPQPQSASGETFSAVLEYLSSQFKQVEPLYRLEKAGQLSGRREKSADGHCFITRQLLQGAQMLGDLWLTAWQQAPPDLYLRSALAKRRAADDKPASH